jgi:hypothetical protein
MGSQRQKDNSTFIHKRHLRLALLRMIPNPVVMETHGGIGKLFASCYSTLPTGVVFERDPMKADFLAQQRPTWAVYRADVVKSLQAGAGAHLEVNFLDLDPYGSPWDVVDAFFSSKRSFAEVMIIVVNDGMRQKLQLAGAWNVKAMRGVVSRYGNDSMFKRYKEVCREMLADRVIQQGYLVKKWTAYYTGAGAGNMTHWAAILDRTKQVQTGQPAQTQSAV